MEMTICGVLVGYCTSTQQAEGSGVFYNYVRPAEGFEFPDNTTFVKVDFHEKTATFFDSSYETLGERPLSTLVGDAA